MLIYELEKDNMMSTKRGFFSEYSYEQEIAVSSEMVKAIGRKSISARVSNARYEDNNIIADCEYLGKVYIVRSESFLDQTYWIVIRESSHVERYERDGRS